jgi:hypothetical protein
VRERVGGSSTILSVASRLRRDFNVMYFLSLCPPAKKKKAEARADSSRTDETQNPCRISKTSVSVLRILVPRKLFRKTESIFAFLHTTSFLKHCGSVPERSPALLLQQKLCASHRGASARGERLWIFSRIFDKVGSSGIVKVLPNETFGCKLSKNLQPL